MKYEFDILNKYGIKHSFYGKPLDYSQNKIEDNVFYLNQCHSNKVVVVEETDKPTDEKFDQVDGIITNLKGKTLVIKTADCQSIFIYDPINKVIGNIHSGWKGTLNTIILNAIDLIIERYGSNKENIICCINPSIGGCHFEISDDVYLEFKEKFNNIDEYIVNKKIVNDEKKYYLDLIKFNVDLLNNYGVKQVYSSNICSYCNEECHSYRRDKTKLRNGSIITM